MIRVFEIKECPSAKAADHGGGAFNNIRLADIAVDGECAQPVNHDHDKDGDNDRKQKMEQLACFQLLFDLGRIRVEQGRVCGFLRGAKSGVQIFQAGIRMGFQIVAQRILHLA